MSESVIRRAKEASDAIDAFIHDGFTRYGEQSGVTLNFDEFCYVAEDADGRITGVITGRAYYDEVHISDLIVDEAHRGSGLGSRLVRAVEDAYRNHGYNVVTLTTFGFQAPAFYQKLGYTLEFIRESQDPKLNKYFLKKPL